MYEINSAEFGRIRVSQIPMPEGVNPGFTTYTPSGRVIVQYDLPSDPKGYTHIISMEDDGTDVHEIFYGDITPIYRSNGFRYMPFNDNKRAYIGDWILECEPDCDHAETSRLVPIHYPDELVNTPGLWMVWSENVVSPDGKTIAFSSLGATGAVYAAELVRAENTYELENLRIVSSSLTYRPDPDHPGCVIPEPVRGGEVKQFVRGGLGLSFVGVGRGAGNSMFQALDSEEVRELTKVPGYDETCMISPDERLGVVMSTRFSPSSDCRIIGLLPRRGNLAIKSNLAMSVYMYAVAGARAFRIGANIGPALVDLSRSGSELDYLGVNLSDPNDEFIFCSPISWHPSCKKVMWNECERWDKGPRHRISVAELLDYVPGETPEIVPVPQEIPYAVKGVRKAPAGQMSEEFRVAGHHSGYALTKKEGARATVTYENFSDDGKTFLNGTETSFSPGLTSNGETTFDADLTMTGEHTGSMKVHLGFIRKDTGADIHLTKDSVGFATYDGYTIDVKDMDHR